MPGDGDFTSFFEPGAGVVHRKAVLRAGILTEKYWWSGSQSGGGGGDGNRSN